MEKNVMAYDFKKEYKELYMPKNKPQIVDVPEADVYKRQLLGCSGSGILAYFIAAIIIPDAPKTY